MSENQVVIRATLRQVQDVLRGLTRIRQAARQNATEGKQGAAGVTAANKALAGSYDATGKAAQRSAKQQAQAAREVQRAVFNLKRELASVSSQAGVGGYLRSGVGALGVAGGTALVGSGVRAYDAKQGLQRSFRYQYGQAQGSPTAAGVRNFSDTYGIPLKDVSLSLRQLAQFFDPAMLMRTMKAYTASGFMTGASPEGMAAAMVQYTQIANSGKVQGDELRIMEEHGFAVRRILREAGLGDRIGSQTNPITFEELNNAILRFGETEDAVSMLAEVSETGSAALTKMANILSQDLLPALGKEFTPVVKDLAKEMPKLAVGATRVIENWEWVGGGIATVWVGMKAAKIAEIAASWNAARSLAALATSSNAASVAHGGGLIGGMRRGRVPRTAGASVFKDTLGQNPLNGLVNGAGVSSGALGPLGTAAGTGGVFVAGALALAGVVEGVGRLAGLNYDDTLFGQIENGLAGRGFKSGSQLRQEIDKEAERTMGPVRLAEIRKAARERMMGRSMSRSQYFMETGDADIFATEARRQEMIQRRQQSESERMASQERNRQANWNAQGRRGGTSPRRASIDRANAEANSRLNYGAAY